MVPVLVTVSSMWLMGRDTDWAVTFVLAPLHGTLLAEVLEPEFAPEFAPDPPLVLPAPVLPPLDLPPFEPVAPPDPLSPPVEELPDVELPDVEPPVWPAPPVFSGACVDVGAVVPVWAAPSSCTPSLSLQAVRERAARATVAAAKRRVRGRAVNADMVIPFGKVGKGGETWEVMRPPNRSAGGVL